MAKVGARTRLALALISRQTSLDEFGIEPLTLEIPKLSKIQRRRNNRELLEEILSRIASLELMIWSGGIKQQAKRSSPKRSRTFKAGSPPMSIRPDRQVADHAEEFHKLLELGNGKLTPDVWQILKKQAEEASQSLKSSLGTVTS